MDRSLSPAKRPNKRRQARHGRAWRRFSPGGVTCRYCPHDSSKHLCTSGQPHFYGRATPEEAADPDLALYRHKTTGGPVLVRRVVVARDAELITAFCRACARELGTHQVLCFQRTLATGEVVGINGSHAIDRTKGDTL